MPQTNNHYLHNSSNQMDSCVFSIGKLSTQSYKPHPNYSNFQLSIGNNVNNKL